MQTTAEEALIFSVCSFVYGLRRTNKSREALLYLLVLRSAKTEVLNATVLLLLHCMKGMRLNIDLQDLTPKVNYISNLPTQYSLENR